MPMRPTGSTPVTMWPGTGTTWDVLAGTMDLSAYMLAEDLVAISNTELDNICK